MSGSMVSSSFDTTDTNTNNTNINSNNDGIKVYQFDNDIDDTILINFTTKLANDLSVGSTGSDDSSVRRGIISRVYNKAIASRVSFKSPRRLVRER